MEESFRLLRLRRPDLSPQIEQLIGCGLAEAVIERPTAQDFLEKAETLLRDMVATTPPSSTVVPTLGLCAGREANLETARDLIKRRHGIVITGPNGIGKTTLATHLAQEYIGQHPVFWYTFRSYAHTHLLWALAIFLARQGFPDTWRRLQVARAASPTMHVISDHAPLTEAQALDRLLDDLQEQNALICLDALPINVPGVTQLCVRLWEMACEGTLTLIITTAQVPQFAHSWPQLPLVGLHAGAARMMLAVPGTSVTDAHAAALARLANGSPQQLLLIGDMLKRQAADPAGLIALLTASAVPDATILQLLDASLDSVERDVLQAVSMLLDTGGTSRAIKAVLQRDHISATLADLGARHLLLRCPDEERDIYTLPLSLQIFYYDGMDRAQRRAMHQRAAAYYGQEESDPLRVVLHLDRAGDHVGAARLAAQIELALNSGEPMPSLGSSYAQLVLEQLRSGELDPWERAAVCTVQGEIAVRLGDYQLAEAQLKQAISLGTAGDATIQANRYAHLAIVYERLGLYTQAEACCAEGLAIIGQVAGPSLEVARLSLRHAEVLFRQSRYEQTAEVCASGLQALPPEPAAADLRVALRHRLVTIRGDQGYYADAIRELDALLPMARRVGDPMLTAAVLNNLGRYCQDLGQSDRARECHQESLHIKEQIGDVAGQVVSLMNLGRLHVGEGDPAAGVVWLREALRRSEQRGLRIWQALTLLNLGQTHLELGEVAQAGEAFSSSRQLYEQLGDTSRIAHCLYLRGDVALALGEGEAAYMYGCQALEQALRIGSVAFESCALRVMGEAALARGLLAPATEYLERAAALQEHVRDPYDQALIWAAQARLAESLGDMDQAISRARESLRLAREQHAAQVIAAMEALIGRYDAGPDERSTSTGA